jgi:hypothetical protein
MSVHTTLAGLDPPTLAPHDAVRGHRKPLERTPALTDHRPYTRTQFGLICAAVTTGAGPASALISAGRRAFYSNFSRTVLACRER